MAIENEQFETLLMETMEKTEKTVDVLNGEYITIRAGRANPHILDKVLVDYYGTPTPINQVGNMSVQEGRCLVISPWDVSMLKVIEKQLIAENLGIAPVNDGKVIRLVFPALTEERRKELVKDINFINGLWYEDVPYSLYAISLSNKISYVKDTMYNYLHRKVSIMNNTSIEKNLDIITVFDYLIKELKDANKYEEFSEEINYLLMKEIYISSVVRVIRTKTNVDKLEVINKLKAYVKSNIK